jgi:hypothetical protein
MTVHTAAVFAHIQHARNKLVVFTKHGTLLTATTAESLLTR